MSYKWRTTWYPNKSCMVNFAKENILSTNQGNVFMTVWMTWLRYAWLMIQLEKVVSTETSDLASKNGLKFSIIPLPPFPGQTSRWLEKDKPLANISCNLHVRNTITSVYGKQDYSVTWNITQWDPAVTTKLVSLAMILHAHTVASHFPVNLDWTDT